MSFQAEDVVGFRMKMNSIQFYRLAEGQIDPVIGLKTGDWVSLAISFNARLEDGKFLSQSILRMYSQLEGKVIEEKESYIEIELTRQTPLLSPKIGEVSASSLNVGPEFPKGRVRVYKPNQLPKEGGIAIPGGYSLVPVINELERKEETNSEDGDGPSFLGRVRSWLQPR